MVNFNISIGRSDNKQSIDIDKSSSAQDELTHRQTGDLFGFVPSEMKKYRMKDSKNDSEENHDRSHNAADESSLRSSSIPSENGSGKNIELPKEFKIHPFNKWGTPKQHFFFPPAEFKKWKSSVTNSARSKSPIPFKTQLTMSHLGIKH